MDLEIKFCNKQKFLKRRYSDIKLFPLRRGALRFLTIGTLEGYRLLIYSFHFRLVDLDMEILQNFKVPCLPAKV